MNSYLFVSPVYQPLNPTGALMPNCYLQFYLGNTTTPTDVYADADLQTPLANPLTADSAGNFVPFYMDSSITYRVQLFDEDDVEIYDLDPYLPPRDFPAGTCFMFMGTQVALEIAYPPAFYQICDGTNGTYDLRGKFPIGVSSTIDPGEAVGTTPGTLTTSADGSHDHGGSSGLATAPLPAHSHFTVVNDASSGVPVSATLSTTRENNFTGGDTQYILRGVATAPTFSPSSTEGAGGSHSHTIPTQGTHTHTVAGTLPPAVGVWFVMRRA